MHARIAMLTALIIAEAGVEKARQGLPSRHVEADGRHQ